jgi:NAD(P)-dependent dehydrogenase (short-subunit alcohol dehydrogenase family)
MGRVALVTGGAKRIGRSIVERLAREGYAVAIHCRRSLAEAEGLADMVTGAGGSAAVVAADLSDAQAVRTIVPRAAAALGPVTLLVNNASEFEDDTVETLTEEGWDRHFAVNLRTPVFLAADFARQAPPYAGASIVNIVDQRVLKLTPQFFSYTLTKAALHTATVTMAQALAPRIRVNAIGPGPTLGNSRQAREDFQKQCDAVLMGRGSLPEEVADAVAFLARSASITGQLLLVDGGQHLAWKTADVYGVKE